jgi:predicted nucleic acid-binding protein
MGEAGELEIIDSDIIEDEISVMPDVERQAKVGSLLMRCVTRVPLTSAVERRGLKLTGWGISPMDALHLASAESARADVLLTTDDDLLRKCALHAAKIRIKVGNPATWLIEYRRNES